VHPKNYTDFKKELSADERSSLSESRIRRRRTVLTSGMRNALIVLIVVVAVAAASYAIVNSGPKPKLYADHAFFDLGKVPQTRTSHTFTFSNTGGGDLKITRIWTSCGCTTAKLLVGGVESPEFGMPGHGGYAGPWEATMAPGQPASLVVYYDSTNMPDYYVGERYVFIDSNDPSQSEFQFTISVEEIP